MNEKKRIDKTEELIEFIKDFITLKVNSILFVKKYEEMYKKLFLKKKLSIKYKVSERLSTLFDDIHTEINYFEPDKEAMKEHPSYLNEKQLYASIKLIYKKIKKLEKLK